MLWDTVSAYSKHVRRTNDTPLLLFNSRTLQQHDLSNTRELLFKLIAWILIFISVQLESSIAGKGFFKHLRRVGAAADISFHIVEASRRQSCLFSATNFPPFVSFDSRHTRDIL
ncbi:hypothetical protein KCU83_g549, partial [Aureobasidium melanogenum]